VPRHSTTIATCFCLRKIVQGSRLSRFHNLTIAKSDVFRFLMFVYLSRRRLQFKKFLIAFLLGLDAFRQRLGHPQTYSLRIEQMKALTVDDYFVV
jgi:hypothetical protein